jgi:F-type H+-transporting ATPase subunit epsilon
MAKTPFQLSVVTPGGSGFDGPVVSVQFPGEDGLIGVWAHHAPMLASMRPGKLVIEEPNHPELLKTYAVGAGFAEVSDNNAILLADTCEAAEEIDVNRAKAALARAKERLAQAARDESIDADRAREAMERAQARLAAGYTRGQ